jgi:hypothetical protein
MFDKRESQVSLFGMTALLRTILPGTEKILNSLA